MRLVSSRRVWTTPVPWEIRRGLGTIFATPLGGIRRFWEHLGASSKLQNRLGSRLGNQKHERPARRCQKRASCRFFDRSGVPKTEPKVFSESLFLRQILGKEFYVKTGVYQHCFSWTFESQNGCVKWSGWEDTF